MRQTPGGGLAERHLGVVLRLGQGALPSRLSWQAHLLADLPFGFDRGS